MAVTTKYTLMEQVRQVLGGGDPSASAKFEPRMAMMFLQQVINKALRIDFFSTTLPSGETLPEGVVMATYDEVAVETYKDRSRSKLPAYPIKLLRGMGVFSIYPENNLDKQIIPLQPGQWYYIQGIGLVNEDKEQLYYELADGYAVYTYDLTKLSIPVTSVSMQLAVMDFDHYSDFDILPLPANMVTDIIAEVVQLLAVAPPPDKKVDSVNEENPQAR